MHKFVCESTKKGFTLLEVLIVLAIVVLLSSIGTGFYLNYGKNVELNSLAQTIASNLKQAQAKAMTGAGGFKWGAHFVNGATNYYEIFSTPTDYSDAGKVIISTNYLGSGAVFTDPAPSSTKDIIFNKISGGTSASSVTIKSYNITLSVSVSGVGNISVP